MKRSTIGPALLAVLVVVSSGCQTVTLPADYDANNVRLAELEARAARNEAFVIRPSGETDWVRGDLLSVGPDSIQWTDEMGRLYSAQTRAIEELRFQRRRMALVAWSVVGVGAGALIGQAVGDEAKWSDDEAVWLGALTGATSGVAVGFWFGLPLTYQFGGP